MILHTCTIVLAPSGTRERSHKWGECFDGCIRTGRAESVQECLEVEVPQWACDASLWHRVCLRVCLVCVSVSLLVCLFVS